MGSGPSKTKAQAAYCTFTRSEFKGLLLIVQDAHSVMQFFAAANMLPVIPDKFLEYKVYSPDTEVFTKGTGAANTVAFIKNFKDQYEKKDEFGKQIKDATERKAYVEKAFEDTKEVLKFLIENLYNLCENKR